MLLNHIKSYFEARKLRALAVEVRAGRTPKGVDKDTIFRALRQTANPNVVEMFGFLSAKSWHPDGTLKRDYGLVSVKEITQAFTKRLVDSLCDSAATMATFIYHKMGAGSTAETDTDTALVTQQVGAAQGSQTHGASSSIYQSVATLTAGSSFGCREHGLFNASTGGVALDRSVVTNIDLNTDDVVTWTYNLTCTFGG